MKYSFNSFFKNFNENGQATSCLEFTMETPDQGLRDYVMGRILEILNEDPDEEEKQSVLGFDTGEESANEVPDEEDEWDGDTTEKRRKRRGNLGRPNA